MKHIRNSVKGVFFLEHQGVPTATLTDFSETIKDGSLCVDRNNHDLYILKSGVWTLFSSGISSGDFIPRAGTNVGLPVTGNIEMQDGVSIERGSSQITFTNDALIFHFSDNDGNPADDCAVTMDRNIIFQLDSTIISVDANSKGNFVYKAKDNFQLFESNDNTIFTKAEDLYLTDVNNTTILNNVKNTNINNLENSMIEGNFDGLTINGSAGALYATYSNSENIFLKGSSVVSKPLYFSYTNIINGSYDIHLDGLLVYTNIRNSTNIYGKGVMGHTTLNDAHLHTYGKWTVTTNDNDGIYSLGDIRFGMNITNSNDISFVGKASNMNIEQSIYISNLGFVSGINLTQTTEALIVNSANAIDTDIIGSKNLTIVNNNNQISLTQIIDTEDLIAFSNQRIESTSSINNILINTKDITLDNSYNNFIIGDGRKDDGITRNGFTGSVGSNNALFGLDSTSTAVYTVGDYNFSFGDIKSDTNQDLKSGNILLGNNTINSTLTDNNIIISGKRSANINHDNRGNNVFLNVGDFNVPDENTVYMPCKFHTVSNGNFGIFDACNISTSQTWTLPDKTGTVALLSDITATTSGDSGIKWTENITAVSSSPVNGVIGLGYTAEGGVTSKLIIPTTANDNDQIGASCDSSSSLIIELSDTTPYTNLQKNQSIILRYDASKTKWLVVSSHLPLEETDGFAAFYVNATAPNGGDGSITTPFNTIEEARDAVIGNGTNISPENQNASIFVLSGVFNITSGNFYIHDCTYDFSDGVIVNYNSVGNFMFDDSNDNSAGGMLFTISGNLTWNTSTSSGFFRNLTATSGNVSNGGKFVVINMFLLNTNLSQPSIPLIHIGNNAKTTYGNLGNFSFTCERVDCEGNNAIGTFLIADNYSQFNISDSRIVSVFSGHATNSRLIQLNGVFDGIFNNVQFVGGDLDQYIGIKGECYGITFDECLFGTSVAVINGSIYIHDDYVYSIKGYVQGATRNTGIIIKNCENTGTNASALILKNDTGNLIYVDFISNDFTVDYDTNDVEFGYYNVSTLRNTATRQNFFGGILVYNNLPTSAPSRTGAIWSDGGTLKIV